MSSSATWICLDCGAEYQDRSACVDHVIDEHNPVAELITVDDPANRL